MHLLTQVAGQVRRGHEVAVVYLKGNGTLAADFEAAGAKKVMHGGNTRMRRFVPMMRWADIVHTHLLKADMLSAPLACLTGKRARLVSGKHNDEQVLKRPLVGWIHSIVGRLPAVTIVLSDHVGRFVEQYGGVPLAKQKRIYYGIDPEPFAQARAQPSAVHNSKRAELGLGANDVVFTCVARFAPQKAHDVLLRAFAQARAALDRDPGLLGGADASADGPPQLRLLLVGDDPFGDGRQRAEAVAEELNLGSSVIFAGIRRDVPQIMGATDVFVMSSLWEGLGLVFLEAMAANLPCLSTQVSAVPEVVVDGETGLLVPPANVEELAQGFLRLAAEPELRKRMGAAGARRVSEQFGLDRMVDETLAVYRGLIEG